MTKIRLPEEQSPDQLFPSHLNPIGKGHSALSWQILSTKKHMWGLRAQALLALAKMLRPQPRILALLGARGRPASGPDQQGRGWPPGGAPAQPLHTAAPPTADQVCRGCLIPPVSYHAIFVHSALSLEDLRFLLEVLLLTATHWRYKPYGFLPAPAHLRSEEVQGEAPGPCGRTGEGPASLPSFPAHLLRRPMLWWRPTRSVLGEAKEFCWSSSWGTR